MLNHDFILLTLAGNMTLCLALKHFKLHCSRMSIAVTIFNFKISKTTAHSRQHICSCKSVNCGVNNLETRRTYIASNIF